MIILNWIPAIWGVVRRWLKMKRPDASCIPEGYYCYTPDDEKNTKKYTGVYWVIPCKYYKSLGKCLNACTFCGRITDDFIFDDQCKMCGENYGID